MQERTPLAKTLAGPALIVAVLGVLPLVWDAPLVWEVLGPLVAAVYAVRALAVVWRQVFSTSSRHLHA
ncbi:hypothetical protein ACI78V_07725 [Geodermatophilus sp. SYSU D00742]